MHGRGMTRVPAHTSTPDKAAQHVEIAIEQLIDLIALQVAREMGADVPDREETHHDGSQQSQNT